MFDPKHIESTDENHRSTSTEQLHTLAVIFHTNEFDKVYDDWSNKGVNFINKRVMSGEGWSFQMAEFRDPEGNLLSLEDGGV